MNYFRISALGSLMILSVILVYLIAEGFKFVHLYRIDQISARQSGTEFIEVVETQRNDFLNLKQKLDSIRANWLSLNQSNINESLKAMHLSGFDQYYKAAQSIDLALIDFIVSEKNLALKRTVEIDTQLSTEKTITLLTENALNIEKNSFLANKNSNKELILKKLQNKLRESQQDPNNAFLNQLLLEKIPKNTPLLDFEKEYLIQFIQLEIQSLEQDLIYLRESDIPYNKINFQKRYYRANLSFKGLLESQKMIEIDPAYMPPKIAKKFLNFQKHLLKYQYELPKYSATIEGISLNKNISFLEVIISIVTGKDWYISPEGRSQFELGPYIFGSFLVSIVALFIAAPIGIFSAIYVSRFSSEKERGRLKQFFDFSSTIPTVLIGFFGLRILGDLIVDISNWPIISSIPGFPLYEHLNIFTASCLLALMMVPTIYYVSEIGLRRLPKTIEDASLALGASDIQTIQKIFLPTAFPSFLTAIIVGYSRAIGETMIVLLCLGNSVNLPSWSENPPFIFQTTQTITGLIAQEMGEAPKDSLHLHALMSAACFLLIITIALNILARFTDENHSRSLRK